MNQQQMYQANDGKWYPVQQMPQGGYQPQPQMGFQQQGYGQPYGQQQGYAQQGRPQQGMSTAEGCCAGLCAGLLCFDCLECCF
ncbi:hypothetical protein Q5752_004029 [Cryptotrichosporon argae]